MVAVSVVLGVVVSGLAIPFAGLVGFATRTTADATDDVPLELETKVLPQRTTIFAGDGSVLATIYDQNRIVVPLDQISRTMVKALVSIEDYRFYEHGALDVKGTTRALVSNLGSGGVAQGGSSLTQQLVKQTLLNTATAKNDKDEIAAATEISAARKVKELRYAIALEKKHSKDWILERYLNTVYFGAGAYGVQAAAKRYFNVNARNLDLNQSAVLAGLVQNPSAFDPTRTPERTIERRDVVLDRMAELHVISQKKADKTKAGKLGLKPQRPINGCVSSRAPFFCNYVVEYLLTDKALGRNKADRDRLLKSGGLKIYTTIDLDDQKAADAAVQSHVQPTDQAIGALAMVEPGTGDVKAIAQSRPMGRKKGKGETYLNYVVPSQYGDSNGFQAGSTFKAFVLADAIEKGTPLDKTFPSPNSQSVDLADFDNCPGARPFAGEYTLPNSVQSDGSESLYTGTRQSINTFFLNLERDVTGVCDPFKLAKSMGVQLTCPDVDSCPGVSLERTPNWFLGVADVSPLEMAEAYATFAARGNHCASRPITSIKDLNGSTLKTYRALCSQVMSQSTADGVNDILRGVIEGGFASAQALSVPAAGKTGTTGTQAKSPSVWFVGYTPQLATASMIAGANQFGTPIGLDGLTINGVTVTASGSGLAAPVWGDAMKALDAEGKFDYVNFEAPDVPGVGNESGAGPQPPSNNGGNGGFDNGGGGDFDDFDGFNDGDG
jgi:membrane peptidoglycan carboxypeptidase